MITLPLKEILGISPELQKRFTGLTKTRREYTASPVTSTPSQDLSMSQNSTLAYSKIFLSYDEENENIDEILVRYSSTVKLHTNPLFAMTTGRFEGTLAGCPIVFMVDTGSELNLISHSLFQQTALALNMDGARWSLKGVNGGPVPLIGCCRDAPVVCGGHRFDHHFFVNREDTGKQDVTLWQPWLQWYSATLAYSRTGIVEMCLWKAGNRDQHECHLQRPTISIQLVAVNAPRNTDRLTVQTRRAAIEEVSDSEN
jgi:hypothetical protein